MQLGFSPTLRGVNICSRHRRGSANGSASAAAARLCPTRISREGARFREHSSPPARRKADFEIPILQQFPISTIDILLFQIICLFTARKCYPCFFLKANPFCSSLKHVRAHTVCHRMTVLTRWQTPHQSMTDHRESDYVSRAMSGVDWRGSIKKASRQSRRVSRERSRWVIGVFTNSLVLPVSEERARREPSLLSNLFCLAAS